MEKKDWKEEFYNIYKWADYDDKKLEKFVQQEIDRAFNRGYAECKKDIAIGVGFAEDPEFSELVSRVAKKLN